jgi:hypothetical protein
LKARYQKKSKVESFGGPALYELRQTPKVVHIIYS